MLLEQFQWVGNCDRQITWNNSSFYSVLLMSGLRTLLGFTSKVLNLNPTMLSTTTTKGTIWLLPVERTRFEPICSVVHSLACQPHWMNEWTPRGLSIHFDQELSKYSMSIPCHRPGNRIVLISFTHDMCQHRVASAINPPSSNFIVVHK